MVLLSKQAVAIWMNFVVANVAVENVFVLARKSKIAFNTGQGAHIVLVNAILLGHDIQADTNSLSNHVWMGIAFGTLVHFPLLLLLRRTSLLFLRGQRLHVATIPRGLEAIVDLEGVILLFDCCLEVLDLKLLRGSLLEKNLLLSRLLYLLHWLGLVLEWFALWHHAMAHRIVIEVALFLWSRHTSVVVCWSKRHVFLWRSFF